MLNLMKKDLKLWFMSKRIWTFLLGVLIMLIISTSWHATQEVQKEAYVSIGVVDLDNSEYSKLMLSYFDESKLFQEYAKVIVGTKEEIEEKFQQGDLTMYLVVPDNFAQNLIDIQNVPMEAYISTEDKTRAIVLKNMLEAYEKYISAVEINCVTLYEVMKQAGMPSELRQQVNLEISLDLVFTALGKADFFEVVELEEVKAVPVETYYAFEILFLFLSFLALLAGMDLLRERRQGLLMRLISTGTKLGLVTTQKLLLYTSLIGSLLGFLYLILSIRGVNIYYGVFVFILLYFALASVSFMLLSSFFTKLPTFLLVSNVLILFGAVLGGGLIPREFLPNSMIVIAKATINYWFLRSSTLLFSEHQKLSITLVIFLILCIILGVMLCSLLISRKEGMHREDI